MSLKVLFKTLFPANVTAASPLTLIKTGLSYAFGLSINDLRLSLDPLYVSQSAGARTRLTADTDFYVATTGNDTTGTGLTVGSPWATPQKAIDTIAQNYDLNGFRAIVNVADGTYSGTGSSGWIVRMIGPFVGGNPYVATVFPSNTVVPVLIRGNTVTPANVIFTCSGSDTVLGDAGAYFGIEGVTLNNTFGGGSCLRTGTVASILFGNCILGPAGDAKVFAAHSSVIECYSNYWITGNSTYIHKIAYNGSIFLSGRTETQLSNITVTAYASVYDSGSALSHEGMTLTPGIFSFTGSKFSIGNGGSIKTGTNNLSLFPGSTKGTITWGSYDDFTRLTSALTINRNAVSTPIAPIGGTGMQIVGADGAGSGILIDGHGNAPGIQIRRTGGTLASPTATVAADILGFIGGGGFGSAIAAGNNSSILFKATGTFTGSSQPASIEFQTTPSGSTTSAARWTIASTGGLYSAGSSGDAGVDTINALDYYVNGTASTGTTGLVRADNPTFTTSATLKSTDASATLGPQMSLFRDSASPAASDLIGYLGLNGRNSSAAIKLYGSVLGAILSPTAGSENGQVSIQTVVSGTLNDRLTVAQGAYMLGATGGDKGSGALNAAALYVNGVAPVLTIKKQTFTTNGTYTPSAGMLYCILEAIGAGGGGGGVGTAPGGSINAWAAGGGAGGYSKILSTAATVGASKAVTVSNAGGAGGSTAGTAGTAGGDSSVGVICLGKGGSGGGGNIGGSAPTGGAGGVAGTGDITATGASGVTGGAMTSAFIPFGGGGSSHYGGGGRSLVSGANTSTAGDPGTGFGGGGGGAVAHGSGANAAGGAGSPGIVYITEFCSQ